MNELVSRKFAIANVLARYFTGEKCIREHISERFVTSGLCVECNAYLCKKRSLEKTKEVKESNKKWRQENASYIYLKNKEWKAKNPLKVIQSSKKYHDKNKDRLKPIRDLYREKTKEQHKVYSKNWLENNKEKRRKTVNSWRKIKLETDPIFASKQKIRGLIVDAFRRGGLKKSNKTEEILGCSIDCARHYIESKFLEGMDWLNHGKWHIDHIIPLSNAKTIDDVIVLSHYKNLQPLWAVDNLKKGGRNDNAIA